MTTRVVKPSHYQYNIGTGIVTVADPAMGGQGGRPPPIDQNTYLGLAVAARLRHGSKISLKSLTFGHFLGRP